MISTRFTVAAVLALLLLGAPVSAQTLGTSFVYQGRLTAAGAPVNGPRSVTFTLHSHATNAAPVGSPVTFPALAITDGLFDASLDFGASVLNGDARWLEIRVEGVTLSPRQRLAPAPYALALPGLRTQQNGTSPNVIGGHRSNSVGAGVYGATIAGGGHELAPNSVTYDYGTIGGGIDNAASGAASTVGGGYINAASGVASTVGGGYFNRAIGDYSAIVGGFENLASGYASTIGGGFQNYTTGNRSVVACGELNYAIGSHSAVPGGMRNVAGGVYSLAAGFRAKVRTALQSGDSDGDEGTFVWADSTNADFFSTGPNRFLIRASGGVGIGTNAPQAPLHVQGASDAGLFLSRAGGGSPMQINPEVSVAALNPGLTTVAAQITNRPLGHLVIDIAANDNADSFAVRTDSDFNGVVDTIAMTVRPSGRVGIGTTTPDSTLTVNGSASKPGGGSWSTFSDARLKHGVTPLEGSLDRLLRLRGVSFVYDDPSAINELPGRRIGMVAQDVERVFPNWVETGASGYKSVTFRGFEALTVEALRELRAENDRLRSELDELKALVRRLAEKEGVAR